MFILDNAINLLFPYYKLHDVIEKNNRISLYDKTVVRGGIDIIYLFCVCASKKCMFKQEVCVEIDIFHVVFIFSFLYVDNAIRSKSFS